MSRDFAQLMEHLAQGTAELELDLPAADGLQPQRPATRRGDRLARVYPLIDGRREPANGSGPKPSLIATVTETECRRLAVAGARWVGPADAAPVQRPYVERVRIRNFRCIREIDFPLTPLHALIGPNDSGKSTILEAVRAFTTQVTGETSSEITVWSDRYALSKLAGGVFRHDSDLDPANLGTHGSFVHPALEHLALVAPARMLRLDPDAMRQPTGLIAQGQLLEFDVRGRGLPAVYDALLSRRIDVFLDISKRFTALFPTARSIQLTNVSQTEKALGIQLIDGRSVGPNNLSEGMLYWLAFAALPYLQPAPLILIEEPENGLHPSRIAEVIGVLREVSRTSQILIATHHPLVINELQEDEVTLITRTTERGTIATPLAVTKNFAQRAQVYALGELWLNYADGDLESDLVSASTLPPAAAG
jgi:ABC-type uncharacterized transport system ATPase subunit